MIEKIAISSFFLVLVEQKKCTGVYVTVVSPKLALMSTRQYVTPLSACSRNVFPLLSRFVTRLSAYVQIHQQMRHPRIVNLTDVFEICCDSFATVLDYCRGTDLECLLRERKQLPERDARALVLQVARGLQYLNTAQVTDREEGILNSDTHESFLFCHFCVFFEHNVYFPAQLMGGFQGGGYVVGYTSKWNLGIPAGYIPEYDKKY